jgi:hypothetical protein
VDVGVIADRAHLGRSALVDRERLSHQALDPLGHTLGAVEQQGRAAGVGQRDDLHDDLVARGDELVE